MSITHSNSTITTNLLEMCFFESCAVLRDPVKKKSDTKEAFEHHDVKTGK